MLGQGGPQTIDLRIDRSEFELWVNAPGIVFRSLRLQTTLGRSDGLTAQGLHSLAHQLKAVAHCGYRPEAPVTIEIAGASHTRFLRFGLGPPSMYLTVLHLSTRNGESFTALIDRTINLRRRDCNVLLVAEQVEGEGSHGGHHLHQGDSRPLIA